MSDQLPAPVMEPAPTSEPTAQQLLIELPAVQQVALQELGNGGTITDAARAAGVHRMTVSRWIHEDPNFAAAHNAWCQELLDSGFSRALAMSDSALTTIANAIKNGHVNAAMQLVKHLNVLRAAKPGSTDADQVKRRGAVRKARREKKLREAEVKQGLRLEEKLENDGITWTRKAEVNLHPDEMALLEALREKAAGRTHVQCTEFSPLDGERQLSDWERQVLFKARAEVLRDGHYSFRNGEPAGFCRELDAQEACGMLIRDGMPEDEARRLMEAGGRPVPPAETKTEQTGSPEN
jgi:hypothetical protein